MKVIVTCGPSYEPIDQVRRLTNFSTGELGVQLSNELAKSGFDVFCLKGSGAVFPGPGAHCHPTLFNTNDDLVRLLEQIGGTHEIGAIFHAAALCDYKVKNVEDDQGNQCHSAKIASRLGGLTLHLEPATKVISGMRALFPGSLLVGWKYELVGTVEEAIAKGVRQIIENGTDACVINGKAFGEGFGFCRFDQTVHRSQSKHELVRFLADWLAEMRRTTPLTSDKRN